MKRKLSSNGLNDPIPNFHFSFDKAQTLAVPIINTTDFLKINASKGNEAIQELLHL